MDRNVVERYRLALFGRMVMGVAHEIDNHLSVVLGFSELIQLAAGNEQKVRDGAGKILSAGEKIGAIVQGLLNSVPRIIAKGFSRSTQAKKKALRKWSPINGEQEINMPKENAAAIR